MPRSPGSLAVIAVSGTGGVVSVAVWIAAGAGVFAALGWAVATVAGFPPRLPVGIGIALGGGIGAGTRYIAAAEEAEEGESVTVEMDRADDPEPADLFEASPDPILYYAPAEAGPVVRAVNPAFEATFGVETATLAGTPLAEGLMTGGDAAAAVAAGESADAVACSTDAGEKRFDLRVAPVGEERGYVVYVPRE